MDLQKTLERVERRNDACKRYYHKKNPEARTYKDRECDTAEAAAKLHSAYEARKQRLRQQRAERGLQPRGRPFKSPCSEQLHCQRMVQLEQARALSGLSSEEQLILLTRGTASL